MSSIHEKIRSAVDISQKAQRNYDLSKSVDSKDLETMIYAATNSPSKQNETHYSLYVYTDKSIIKKIYKETKQFSVLGSKGDFDKVFQEQDGKFYQSKDHSVYNSQILSNILFVFVEDHGTPRGGNSMIAQQTTDPNTESVRIYEEQCNYSIGIAVGELILSATLLGYKTGICSAFPKNIVGRIINSEYDPKLLVGVGYENVGIDRRLHAEVLNKNIVETRRTGELNEKWRFPSFKKHTKVFVNGNKNT